MKKTIGLQPVGSCSFCCATGGACASGPQDPYLIDNAAAEGGDCVSNCGVPSFTPRYWSSHEKERSDFLQKNGASSASLFDALYGYGATNQCGKNINYFSQFDAADMSHCITDEIALSSERAADAIDQYRGLDSWRQLRGWNTRHTAVLPNCCAQKCACGTTLAQSCNGNLPYPYAQPSKANKQQAPTLRFWLT